MHMTPHTPAKHTHTQASTQRVTHSHIQTYIHMHCMHSHPNCSSVLLNVWQSAKAMWRQTNTHTNLYTARERERESAPKRVSSSRKQRLRMREREPVPPNPPHSQSGNYFTQLSLLIFCVFILNFCGSMCLANPKNNKNFEFTTACSAVCTVRKLQRTRSCSLALTNAHCYCPCLCRLFSMRMRDAARCFRSHS